MEKLTIQQIAPYLPYNPKIEILNHAMDYTGIKESTINGYYFIGDSLHVTYKGGNTGKSSDEFKLKLLPISCLTKEITHKGETFVPILKLAEISYPSKNWYLKDGMATAGVYYGNEIFFFDGDDFKCGDDFSPMHIYNQQKIWEKLAEWHINFVGIPEGLYIDKSKL